MTNADQWYIRYPQRYQAERDAMLQRMAACHPQEVLLEDGRRGFRVELKIPDPEGEITDAAGAHHKQYTVLLVWNSDHPHSVPACYGSSICCCFVKPTIQEMAQDFRRRGRGNIPHLYSAVHPITGEVTAMPDTAQLRQEGNRDFNIVAATGLICNWLCAYSAAKYSKSAYDSFRGC